MKKVIKISLHVLAVLIALLVLALFGGWYYVKHHKQEFITFITSETEKSLNKGSLHIGNVSIGFKSSFPLIALTIDSIYLRDSLWNQHHHDLVSANRAYATIGFWQLFRGEIVIQRLELDKPDIYLYTDSLGYSNTSVFKKSKTPKQNKTENRPYPVLEISNGMLSVDARDKHKYFGFQLRKLECSIREKTDSPVLSIDVDLDCLVQQMAFNLEKGPFLENKTVQGVFHTSFNKDSKSLDFENILLNVDRQPFVFTGKFLFAEAGTPFILSWETKDFSFRQGVSFLATNLRKTLRPYDISDSIADLRGSLDNSQPNYSTPLIHLWLNVVNKTITSPFVVLNNASFTATFNNESIKNKGHEDSNTVIHFFPLQGSWEKLNFRSDSVVLSNLIHPSIKMNIISGFPLDVMNHFLEGNAVAFMQGSVKIDLAYSGSLENKYDSSRLLIGNITLDGAGIKYVPGNLLFSPVGGIIRFTGKDMIVDNLKLHTGNSDMSMNGKVKSIFYLLNHLDDKPSFFWNITSKNLNLDDFTASQQQNTKPVEAEKKISPPATSVSEITSKLKKAHFNFELKANKLTYKKFIIDSLQATLVLDNHSTQLKNVRIGHIRLPIDESDTHKFFGFRIRKLECNIQEKTASPLLAIDLNLDCLIQEMTFNREKGPFLENKTIRGEFRSGFNKDTRVLDFKNINLVVDQQPFVFTGKFLFAEAGTPFILSWDTRNFIFRKGVSFLSTNLRKTLEPYDISDTIAHLTGSLDNSEPQYGTPLIHLWLTVENKNITSPFVSINNASFTATYNNEYVKNRGHEDSNTVIHFSSFHGRWEKLNIHADSLVLTDLIHPKIKVNIISDFQLGTMNSMLNENELAFTQGSGKIDIAYSGSLDKSYDSLRLLTGNITLNDAGIHYIPRNLLFIPVSGVIRFTGKDMIVDNLKLQSQSSDLDMNGKLKGIFYLLNRGNEKPSLYWNITSNRLSLNDFTGYLQKKINPVLPEKKKPELGRIISKFVSNLIAADFNVSLSANQLDYKKFMVDSLHAALVLNENSIQLKDVSMQHGEGSIYIKGIIRNDTADNPFYLETRLNNVNVSRLFYVFDNFGLESLTDKNIHGNLSADITMEGGITPKAHLIHSQFKSSVKFSLKNGELVNFEPIQQIQEKILKKRNLSNIRFADLHDSLEVNGENITINRMEIRSSVLSMFVNGIYNMQTGPDFSIQVPLSNLKAIKDSVPVNKGIHSRTGVSARLWVRRGGDGKLEVKWDPFNKANKEMKENKKSD
jgi:hypothetical protein